MSCSERSKPLTIHTSHVYRFDHFFPLTSVSSRSSLLFCFICIEPASRPSSLTLIVHCGCDSVAFLISHVTRFLYPSPFCGDTLRDWTTNTDPSLFSFLWWFVWSFSCFFLWTLARYHVCSACASISDFDARNHALYHLIFFSILFLVVVSN